MSTTLYRLKILSDKTVSYAVLCRAGVPLRDIVREIQKNLGVFKFPELVSARLATPKEIEDCRAQNFWPFISKINFPPKEIKAHGATYVLKEEKKEPKFCDEVCSSNCPFLEDPGPEHFKITKRYYPHNTILLCSKYWEPVDDIYSDGLVARCEQCSEENKG